MGSSLVDYLMRRRSIFGLPLWELLCIGISLICAITLLAFLWLLISRRKARGRSRVFMQKEDPSGMEEDEREANPNLHCRIHYPFTRGSNHVAIAMKDSTTTTMGKAGDANNAGATLESKTLQTTPSEAMPLRAYNLDKADQEYKGKLLGRAKLAARGEEVRREIAASLTMSRHGECIDRERMVLPFAHGDYEEEEEEEEKDCIAVDYSPLSCVHVDSDLGWGYRYSLSDLEKATNFFDDSYVLGEGSHAIVYYGQLPDGTLIALRKLIINGEQANKEFHVEVEAIGRVRHKNLVGLMGYCMEGSQRILVYEYMDNGNLEQWLHGPLGDLPPLSWDLRMKIIIGTAKGLAYLHEGLEPKVVHRDVKSSNILLDSQWNAKVSDFGLAKLLSAEHAHITTMVMGTFGYVAPEYASMGMLTEKSDVFSYGVLVMELVTGKVPVDVNRKPGEVNIVDWLKTMVNARRLDEVIDEKIEVKPSSRSLKRVLLVALRCVDPDPKMRPKMSHVVHMLEVADNCYQLNNHNMDTSRLLKGSSRKSDHVNRALRSWR